MSVAARSASLHLGVFGAPPPPDGVVGSDDRLVQFGLVPGLVAAAPAQSDGMVFGDTPSTVKTVSFVRSDGMVFADTPALTRFQSSDYRYFKGISILDDAVELISTMD